MPLVVETGRLKGYAFIDFPHIEAAQRFMEVTGRKLQIGDMKFPLVFGEAERRYRDDVRLRKIRHVHIRRIVIHVKRIRGEGRLKKDLPVNLILAVTA